MPSDSRPSTVDLILPVYNAEPYLEACLKSVVQQEHADWRLLAYDDGSTDSSGEILRALAEKDGRVVYFRHANLGPGATRNRALDQVSAPWVSFLDADDLLPPTIPQAAPRTGAWLRT